MLRRGRACGVLLGGFAALRERSGVGGSAEACQTPLAEIAGGSFGQTSSRGSASTISFQFSAGSSSRPRNGASPVGVVAMPRPGPCARHRHRFVRAALVAVVASSCMNSTSAVADLDPGDAPTPDVSLLDKVVNLCVRRGFVFRSADIYGGFRSAYDYGPLGVLLLRNIKDHWWRSIVQARHDVVGLDAAVLSPPAVWEASGHLDNFTDPMADCRSCGVRHRLDKLADPDVCEACGKRGALTDPRQFNLMFSTHAGPVADTAAVVYLRPETAQGTFINFENVIRSQPQNSAVRDRPDRQIVPQRDHPRQFRVPHPRVRADGTRILRAASRLRNAGTDIG